MKFPAKTKKADEAGGPHRQSKKGNSPPVSSSLIHLNARQNCIAAGETQARSEAVGFIADCPMQNLRNRGP